MGDRGFIIGLGNLLNKDLVRTDVDISKLEESIAGMTSEPALNPVDKYAEEIKTLKEIVNDPEPIHPAPSTEFSPMYEPAHTTRPTEDYRTEPTPTYETRERVQFEQIEKVTREIFGADAENVSFENDRRETDRIYMLEEIAMIRSDLDDLNIDISPYKTTDDMSYEEIKRIFSRIKWRHSTEEYGTLVGQIITMGARFCESLFDGNRIWFGRFQPDLTDWSQTLHPNIRNIRSSASRAMGQFMQGNSMAFDLAVQFIPSMFMQMDKNHRRKQNALTYSEQARRSHVADLRN